jgi:hypothetical protein
VNLPVNLAGHAGRWRFHGSSRIDDLLINAPWGSGGGVIIVRTVLGFSRDVTDALVRDIRAVEGGRVGARILPVPPEQLGDGLVQALDRFRRPGADPRQAGLEQLDRVADWLTNQPMVLLVGPAPTGLAPTVLAEARDLHDWTLKKASERAVTVLMLDTPNDRSGGGSIDLTVGWPVDATLPNNAEGAGRLWRSYLHVRVAWETAGDLSRASRWSAAGFCSLADEDDNGCEDLLNRLSAEEYGKAGSSMQKSLTDYINAFLHPIRSRSNLLQRADDLSRDGLVWCPDGSGWPQPVPWAARAALSTNALPDAKSLLCGCLICRPLARELQGRCLDLESRERAVCWTSRMKNVPHPDADRRWQEYSADPAYHARAFYPVGCPAEPTDSWPFTTFGEFLHATSPNSPKWTVWHDLRELRNGLAHNHYLCWGVVVKLLDIESRLDP